ncbi:uncharacterized protein B0T23DRAFT_400047 [Neurospora hispaniola]|uniref:Uncharacterized protein n=1 Tax=Neurospora hispaniola TaxID=588809 RepID=A0AAJ0HYX1_9PEZI|nr:hypothetical protein B0T23DRAFT_400047 [Neurospora hispaniola]
MAQENERLLHLSSSCESRVGSLPSVVENLSTLREYTARRSQYSLHCNGIVMCSDLDLKSATNLTSTIPHRFEDTGRYHVKKCLSYLPSHPGDIIVHTGTVRYSEGGRILACGIPLCAGAALRGHARASVSGTAMEVAEPLAMFDIFAVVFIAIPRTFAIFETLGGSPTIFALIVIPGYHLALVSASSQSYPVIDESITNRYF